jgi:hypothetical protein
VPSTPSATASPTATHVACYSSGTLTGSIGPGDPAQTGRLNRDGVASACAAPKTCPSVLGTEPRRYDAYSFRNNSGAPACYTVRLNAGTCVGANFIFSAAYLGGFQPGQLCSNFLADIGASPNPVGSYSFTVPANTTFVVVVHEVDMNAGCDSYSLSVTTCNCEMTFTDVQQTDYFYDAVQYLYCNGAISGYADNTFRPYNNTTRGQLSKIVVLAERWTINTAGGPHFADVPSGSTFYGYIETAYNRGVISGYADGTFRPGSDVTRGQLSKIIVLAEQWAINTTGGPHFGDVAPGSAFYTYIETAYNRGIISGYADGTFRPGNNATRGQISKIAYNAVTQP